jgi:SAM-dependent methyltransferase
MMQTVTRNIDALSSPTLKHLRERWWDESFTSFLKDTLQPRAGSRILDVGCGTGTAEVQLSRLRISQVSLVGVDVVPARVREAINAAKAHNIRARYAGADGCALPFADATFDSTFCVAVLQHIRDVDVAVGELARVTKPGGRVLAVEPDNRARYWYSSVDAGMQAFEVANRLFAAIADARGDTADPVVGPRLPAIFARKWIEPSAVELFPVTVSHLGAPPKAVWDARREAVSAIISRVSDDSLGRLATDYQKLLAKYAEQATAAGPSFVEIQNTLLFATAGIRSES